MEESGAYLSFCTWLCSRRYKTEAQPLFVWKEILYVWQDHWFYDKHPTISPSQVRGCDVWDRPWWIDLICNISEQAMLKYTYIRMHNKYGTNTYSLTSYASTHIYALTPHRSAHTCTHIHTLYWYIHTYIHDKQTHPQDTRTHKQWFAHAH